MKSTKGTVVEGQGVHEESVVGLEKEDQEEVEEVEPEVDDEPEEVEDVDAAGLEERIEPRGRGAATAKRAEAANRP